MTEQQAREQITFVAHRLWQMGWVASNDGNISIKLDDNTFITTPTGVSKAMIEPDILVKADAQGNILEAKEGYKPSSEFPMHLICYKEREDITAVVHAHPPTATGFAIANIPLDRYTMPEAILALGSVPIANYGTPSTQEVPDSVKPYLPEHDVILLQNHGALAVGVDVMTAYYKMETLELFAKTSLVAIQLGGEKELNEKQIQDCLKLREKFNMKGRHPGFKRYRKA